MADGICQLCKRTFHRRLGAHHLFGKENDPDNEYLIALCSGCHQLVGHLGGRADVAKPEFWENLIILAVMRSERQEGYTGHHVTVEIEKLTEDDVAEMHEATAEYGNA